MPFSALSGDEPEPCSEVSEFRCGTGSRVLASHSWPGAIRLRAWTQGLPFPVPARVSVADGGTTDEQTPRRSRIDRLPPAAVPLLVPAPEPTRPARLGRGRL